MIWFRQYLNPNCRYVLGPRMTDSGEYLNENSSSTRNNQSYLQCATSIENNNVTSEKTKSLCPNQNQAVNRTVQHNLGHGNDKVNHKSHSHDNFCNPCIRHLNKEKKGYVEKDNVSLEAYDLVSPCCDLHCVPTK